MNTQELLQELLVKVQNGQISQQEIWEYLNTPTSQSSPTGLQKGNHFSVTKMLYILGAAIVVIGIVIFVSQIWVDINSFGRILITLGLGLFFAGIGSVFMKQRSRDSIGAIFHLMGGVLIPMGSLVTLRELATDSVSLWPVAIAFGLIFALYIGLSLIHRQALLTFFAIANGTAFVYLTVAAIIQNLYTANGDIYAYVTMLVGISYLLLAQAFREGWNRYLLGALYLFGSTALLGAAFSQVMDSVIWQIGYFLIVLAGLFLSVYMKSRSILVMSTIFLIAHVSFITSKYFADSLGWPISLVILGFIFIGLGYASVTINQKYIQDNPE